MAGIFNSKFFNYEVFRKYIETIPNTRQNLLLQSRAIRNRPELAASLRDDVGGNYLSTPLRGLIGGKPQNYDGQTDIVPESTDTYMHSRVVVGRDKAWEELDFSYDITGGEDFMQNVATQVNDYWNEIDQDTIVSILKGIFNMTGAAEQDFVKSHTYDISKVANAADRVMSPATGIVEIGNSAFSNCQSFQNVEIPHSVLSMQDAPDEQTKKEFQRFVSKLESM